MILLTGATGFVGNALLKQLMLQPNVAIRTYGRRVPEGADADRVADACAQMISHMAGEISAAADYAPALVDVDVLIHCAAQAHINKNVTDRQAEFNHVNCDGALKLARQAIDMGVKRFVFVSSIGVNGTSTDQTPFNINLTANPHNAYAQSKYHAECSLTQLAEGTGLEVVIVRPTLVYGPNAPGNFGLLTKLVEKLPVLPFGLVKNKRDFIAVQNLADLLITCATHPNAAGHTFLASDMETVSIKQFTNAIADGLGKKVFQLPIPVSLMRLAGKLMGKSTMVEQLVGNLQVDSSNIKEVLDWTPPLTMRQAMATLRDSGKSSSGKE